MSDDSISETAEAAPGDRRSTRRSPTVPRIAILGMSAFLALLGLLAVLAGTALNGVADRERIAEMAEAGTIEAEGLTEAEAIDVITSMAWWGSVGLIVTGLLLLVGGLAFAFARRSGTDPVDGPPTITHAVVGAFVTVLVSFVPVSPILGGAVAGYFERDGTEAGAVVGGLSGLFAALPFATFLGFLFGGAAVGLLETTDVAPAWVVGTVVVLGALVVVAITVVLGGLGGAVGNYLVGEDVSGE